jgi:hypothetical protein
MAKRQRTRPGRRPPSNRPARPAAQPATPATPAQSRPSASLSAAEEARAAEIEAQILADERAASASRDRRRDRRRGETGRTRESAPIELRAEQEYAYVVRDVRRIVRVGGSLLIILAVLFILIDVLGIIRL